MDMMLAKKKRIALEKRNRMKQPNTTKNSFFGFLSSVTNNTMGSESEWADAFLMAFCCDFHDFLILDIGQLRLEIGGLEELQRQLFLELHDMKNMQERQRWSETLQGKYFNFLGSFFSLYCVWKIIICTINIVFDRVGKKDVVTRGIEIAVNWCGIQFDVAFWSQHISFLLVGCIVVTSIRGLLITLTKVMVKREMCDQNSNSYVYCRFQFFYKISSSKSSNIIVLILAQIMGMYFCSSVLLIRMNMPAEYRVIITEVLGGLQFNFFHRWFDVIFLLSALTSILLLFVIRKPPVLSSNTRVDNDSSSYDHSSYQ